MSASMQHAERQAHDMTNHKRVHRDKITDKPKVMRGTHGAHLAAIGGEETGEVPCPLPGARGNLSKAHEKPHR